MRSLKAVSTVSLLMDRGDSSGRAQAVHTVGRQVTRVGLGGILDICACAVIYLGLVHAHVTAHNNSGPARTIAITTSKS